MIKREDSLSSASDGKAEDEKEFAVSQLKNVMQCAQQFRLFTELIQSEKPVATSSVYCIVQWDDASLDEHFKSVMPKFRRLDVSPAEFNCMKAITILMKPNETWTIRSKINSSTNASASFKNAV